MFQARFHRRRLSVSNNTRRAICNSIEQYLAGRSYHTPRIGDVMPLTRREAVAALAVAPTLALRAAEPTGIRLSTFVTEVTPPLGHPCMGGGIAPVAKIDDPLFAIGLIL